MHPFQTPGPATRHIALLNPNTSEATTELMLRSARRGLPASVEVAGRTAPRGCAMITTPDELDAAAMVVADYGAALPGEGFDAIIIAGFGDPGLDALRVRVSIPVIGLAEAGIAAAAAGGRRFSIVTVTPALEDSLRAAALRHGQAGVFASVRFTTAPLHAVMQTPAGLAAALLETTLRAVREDGAEAVVIGGGPLAQAASTIAAELQIPVIDPVAAAVSLACTRLPGTARLRQPSHP